MSDREFVHTTFGERRIPKDEAIRDAKILIDLSSTARFAELLSALSHNAHKNLDDILGAAIHISDVDANSLSERRFIQYPRSHRLNQSTGLWEIPPITIENKGMIAISMYSLDEQELQQGRLTLSLREPFSEIKILASQGKELALSRD